MNITLDKKGLEALASDPRTYTAEKANADKKLKGVIPQEYLFIGNKCFMNNGKIHTAVLPSGCLIIGDSAFENCQFQKEVVFPEKLVYIGSRAFARNHRLRKVHLPASVKAIGEECYKECNFLFSVEFAEESSLKVLPEGMFDSCVRLKTVQLPGKIKAIGKRAFYRCKELNELFLPKGLEEIRKEAFYFCGIESLDFPEGLKKIEEHAFFRCKKLRKVKLPSSVEYIGKEAFHGCDWLEILEIRHDPEFLGDWLVNRNCTIYCVEGSKVDKYCDKFEYKREYVTREANGNG